MDNNLLRYIELEEFDEKLIAFLAENYNIDYEAAMRVYYSSEHADKVFYGEYDTQKIDYKDIANLLQETGSEC